MRRVTLDEVLGLGAYEAVRDAFRARMIAHKRVRRALLGPEVSVVFEDHDTALMQIQEMLRAERISDPTAVRFELETYNDMVPPDGALRATLMVEVEDPDARERKRREYVGIDTAVALELGDARVPARFAPEGLLPDRIAVVQYLTFDLPPDGRARLLDPAGAARLVCAHPRYAHTAELSDALRRSVAHDLDPANAARRP